ncbi:MAG: hypothetical protein MUF30_07175 [Burkholderiales bacterium]|nr:hypothetical protein [Burkholderiales bacterium]
MPPTHAGAAARWLRRPDVRLAAMLAALHVALTVDVDGAASRAFLLAHFGLFLLWQPVWRGERRLDPVQAAALVGAAALLAWWNDWGLLALWLGLLISLIGGNVPGGHWRDRVGTLAGTGYLLSMLLLWVVPNRFEAAIGAPAEVAVRFLLPAFIAVVCVSAARAPEARPRLAVDLVYSLLIFLLVAGLVLGTFFVQQVSHGSYPLALAQTVLVLGALLALLSWLWDPRGGFAGIGQLLSRYFLSLGLPFERWMMGLASAAQVETDPERFVAAAVDRMLALPWVAGVEWTAGAGHGFAGVRTVHATPLAEGALALVVHTRTPPPPALLLHLKLLCRLAADYHDAKLRAQAQQRSAYLEAIHETGSRLTHDVKNLLQSLRSLIAVAAPEAGTDPQALRALMQRQLPEIARRLQVTLDKLDAQRPDRVAQVPVAQWWRGVSQRRAHEPVAFDAAPVPTGATVPADLFDSVVDNLLANALEKRRRGECSRIVVSLQPCDGGVQLGVADDGIAVPEALARHFFVAPVTSASGLGIGLYQVGRLAARLGWALRLAVNRDGDVRFVLAPASAPHAHAG